MIAQETCFEALREAEQRLGESPTKAQYEQLGLTPSASTILRVTDGWNAAKEQAGLDTEYSRGPRLDPQPDNVTIPDELEWSELSADQRWHYRHRETNNERTKTRRGANRAWVYAYKRDVAMCIRCGEADPACLDFHHLDQASKEMAIGQMVTYGYSREKIRAEMEKCSILCSNCHRKEHYTVPAGVDTFSTSKNGESRSD